MDYQFEGLANMRSDGSTVELCVTSETKTPVGKSDKLENLLLGQKSQTCTDTECGVSQELSLASENTDVGDSFKLNLEIQAQYRLEN